MQHFGRPKKKEWKKNYKNKYDTLIGIDRNK